MTTRPMALLLDDDPAFGAILGAELKSHGVTLIQARRAREVDAALGGARPDVYVVDGLLPDADGPGWIEQLRARDPRTPVAFVSAFWHDLHSFERFRKELGVAVVARKPVVPAVLAEQIALLCTAAAPAPFAQAPVTATPVAQAPVAAERAGTGLAEELAGLRRAYAARLPEEVAALSAALRGATPEARTVAHRLRGTAGTYGFERVSALAGAIEDALGPRGSGAAAPGTAAALASLEQAARVAAAGGAPGAPVPAVEPDRERVLAVGLPAPLGARLAATAFAAGLELELASDWSDALRRAYADPPDVAVLGAEGASRAQVLAIARELGTDDRVVLVGSGDGLEARDAAIRAGVSVVLREGVEPEKIVTSVRQLLHGRAAERPSVLVVDDDAAFARYVCATLRAHGLRAEALADPSRLLDALRASRPDALLLDVAMPGLGGLDLCRILRRMPDWQDLPILLVTAHTDAATRLAAYEAGADDHVAKPIVEQELVARIVVRVERQRLLRERADRDALTGVSSRRAFLEALEARVSESRRRGRRLVLVVLDLDRFKHINDAHGHLVGDRVLAALGRVLSRRLRREDLRCRWGGEEFALALAEEDVAVAASVVRELLREFQAIAFEGSAGERFSASFSAGVASCPADGTTIPALIEAADRRCYAAKRAGRAQVVADATDPAPPGSR